MDDPPECPRCPDGGEVAHLGGTLYQCRAMVVGDVVPAHLAPSGLTTPVYRECGFRFDLRELEEVRSRRRREQEDKASGEREQMALRRAAAEKALGILASASEPGEVVEALARLRGSSVDEVSELIPRSALQAAWERLVQEGAIGAPSRKVALLERSPNLLGFIQRLGDTKTEWGSWRELERFPIFPAGFAADGENLIDAGGRIWFTSGRQFFRNNVGDVRRHHHQHVVLASGEKFRLGRGKQPGGWTTYFQNAELAFPRDLDVKDYLTLVKAALAASLSLDRSSEIRPSS